MKIFEVSQEAALQVLEIMEDTDDKFDRPARILIATGNAGKLREFEDLLAELPLPFIGLNLFDRVVPPEETGISFAENAVIKASGYATQTREWTMADDSGLEIDAMGGAPGIFSARFGGETASYNEKIRSVLERMLNVEEHRRQARFVSVIALAKTDGEIAFSVEGECRGTIALEPRGTNGFGYDPIFIPQGFDETFGELPEEKKSAISHRGKASAEFIRKMLDFIGV